MQQFLIQSDDESQSGRIVSFIIPFQSPVATRNNVKKVIPKLEKLECSSIPSHGWSSLHSVTWIHALNNIEVVVNFEFDYLFDQIVQLLKQRT